jgi:hypothetical protein
VRCHQFFAGAYARGEAILGDGMFGAFVEVADGVPVACELFDLEHHGDRVHATVC